ncbi:MAG: DUF262 domain-containing protein [Pyrinomonadaceae bacterium]|nr:DUF262 domain-containing protein [Pyrinomonadaceae bacterium]
MDRIEYQPTKVQDILDDFEAEKLDLNPWYQRRSTWSRPQKAYLINTIFEKKPIPSLFIRHSLDLEKEKSIKEVVDGQQRIRSILEFKNGDFAARHPEHATSVRYSKLLPRQKEEFRMTSLSIGYLIGASDPDVIDMFGRLNSVNKTLNLQEKRNAKYSGEFKQFCLKQASLRVQLWRNLGIFSANDIARMTEVQFVSELVVNLMRGLRDYSAAEIDRTYSQYEEDFTDESGIEKRCDAVFGKVVSLPVADFKDTIFSRPPLFFSLFLILDSMNAKISDKKLSSAIHEIDERFNSDVPVNERSQADAEFFVACQSNPHRIKSRQIRNDYIKSILS